MDDATLQAVRYRLEVLEAHLDFWMKDNKSIDYYTQMTIKEDFNFIRSRLENKIPDTRKSVEL